MSTRLPKKELYTVNCLSGVSRRCDWFINGTRLLNISKTSAPKTVFLTAYRGGKGVNYLVDKLLPKITNRFVLIVASDDFTFPSGRGDLRKNLYRYSQQSIARLLDSPYLIQIYVENLDTEHVKMTPIPLGILPWENTEHPIEESVDFTLKNTLCLCRHRSRPLESRQWNDRLTVDRLCKTVWRDFVKLIEEEIPREDFIKELKQAKFVLCIHGGGYDPCPRFFECILYGAIPIIQHSPLDEVFSRFPVVFIEDLTEGSLSEKFLLGRLAETRDFYTGEKRKQVLSMLTLDYWWQIITSRLSNKNLLISRDVSTTTVCSENGPTDRRT